MTHFSAAFIAATTAALLATPPAVHVARAQLPAGGLPSAHGHGFAAPSGQTMITGKVAETMNAAEYTYVLVDDGTKKVWAAAPRFTVAVGDTVVVPEGVPMRDFHSSTLKRTFDVVYFVSGVQVAGGEKAAGASAPHAAAAPHAVQPPHGAAALSNEPTTVDLSNIEKAAGGYTVAELFAKKAELAGKDVAVRGRVVKYTPSVMGKNWIHIRDGSGNAGTNDLAVTTGESASVGDTVLVRGKLGTDKDYGFGYKYGAIIEDASVKIE